jgi:hypothetical protein
VMFATRRMLGFAVEWAVVRDDRMKRFGDKCKS